MHPAGARGDIVTKTDSHAVRSAIRRDARPDGPAADVVSRVDIELLQGTGARRLDDDVGVADESTKLVALVIEVQGHRLVTGVQQLIEGWRSIASAVGAR
jgi:hypothetical protein